MGTFRLESGWFWNEPSELDGGDVSQSGDKQTSQADGGDAAAGADVDRIVELAVEKLMRRQQAEKDRGVANANKQSKAALSEIGELKKQLAAKGVLTPETAEEIDRIERDLDYEALKQTVADLQAGGVQAPQQPAAAIDYVGTMQAVGYDPARLTGAETLALMKLMDEAGDPAAARNALLQHRAAAAANEPPANGAGFVPGSRPPVGRPDEQTALRAEYEAERKNLRPGDVQGLAALKARYRQKGLEIW